jgi:hypothetical protein
VSSHHLELWAADLSLGGFVRLDLSGPRATVWAYLVGDGRPVLAVRDDDVDHPRPGAGLEIRASGLWLAIHEETPAEHWSVGVEAFGVLLDDPEDALTGERGDRAALGFDLEWEGPDDALNEVHGEILVDDEVITFAGLGRRTPVPCRHNAHGDGHRVLIPTTAGVLERHLTTDGWCERPARA